MEEDSKEIVDMHICGECAHYPAYCGWPCEYDVEGKRKLHSDACNYFKPRSEDKRILSDDNVRKALQLKAFIKEGLYYKTIGLGTSPGFIHVDKVELQTVNADGVNPLRILVIVRGTCYRTYSSGELYDEKYNVLRLATWYEGDIKQISKEGFEMVENTYNTIQDEVQEAIGRIYESHKITI